MPRELLVGLEEIRRRWPLYLLIGLVMVSLGVMAMAHALVASLASVIFFGWMLIFSGFSQSVLAFVARGWSGLFLHLLGGILEIVVGVLVVAAPVDAAVGLTLLLAVYLLVGGLFRLIASLVLRYPGAIWGMLGGFVSFLLGLALWRQTSTAGLVFIGICVGVALFLHGVAWMAFALSLHRIPSLAKT